jgi:hypothetical protein
MMDPSNINSFEDQWRKALKEASEAPPPSVWEGIEARLNNEQEKVVPLWWQSPKLWYAAASIAALLLVGGGIWYSGSKEEKVQVAVSTKPVQGSETNKNEAATDQPKTVRNGNEDQIASAGKKKERSAKSAQMGNASKVEIAVATDADNAVQPSSGAGKTAAGSNGADLALNDISQKSPTQKPSNNIAGVAPGVQNTSPAAFEPTVNNSVAIAADKEQSISAKLLASLPYSDLDVYVQKRLVFFRPETQIKEPVKTTKPKEYYAGIGVMPASFNPNLRVKEAPTAFLNQAVGQKRSVSGSSEAGASYALQTQGGVRVSKHWSFEAGLSYLKGNSDYQGGGYVLNAYNSMSANVLENALASANSPAFADKSSNFDNGALYIDVAKKVSNNYQYLQLPVQAGFTLNPDKKLSYSVLGGMMANFFLSNELEAASGEIIKTTASDDIYRSMNWAATTGLRLNYKLSSNWGANLTGSYQRAVSSSFRPNQSLESHPYLYGVSWSVRYSF